MINMFMEITFPKGMNGGDSNAKMQLHHSPFSSCVNIFPISVSRTSIEGLSTLFFKMISRSFLAPLINTELAN